MKYNIVIFGVKKTTQIIIKYLYDLGYKIDLIVSLDNNALKNYHISGYQNLKKIANEIDAEYYCLKNYMLTDKKDEKFFLLNDFDIGISYDWQRLIPMSILNRFKYGVFGFHGSSYYLPKGRGRSPLNWSLIENRKIIHNHLFKYDEAADEGPIFNIKDFEIAPFDNVLTLQYKSILTAKFQLKQLLESYENKCIKLTQQAGEPSFYKKRKPEDGQIDLKKSAGKIYNLVRGVTKPFPGAFCYNKKNKLFIWDAVPFDNLIDFSKYEVGEVIENLYDMPIIKTVDGTLLIRDYESKNKLKKGDILK